MSKKNIRPQSGKQLYLNQLFLKGMLHTSSEMTEGFVKTLTNFDITPTGDSAIPRKPFNKYNISNDAFLEGDYIYPVQFKQAINQQHYIKFENTITEDNFVRYNEGNTYPETLTNFGIKMFSRNKNLINGNTNNIQIHGAGSSTNYDETYATSYEFTVNNNSYIIDVYDPREDNPLLCSVSVQKQNVLDIVEIDSVDNTNFNNITSRIFDVDITLLNRVPDGDSGYLNQYFPFRLMGINCPEVNNEYHDFSKVILRALLVTAYNNYGDNGFRYFNTLKQDKYGRNIIELFVKRPELDNNWVSVNKLMILLGLANIDYAYSYIYINEYINEYMRTLITLDNLATSNLKNKDDIDPFYNYAYNIITNNSIKINETNIEYKVVAVRLHATSYPSNKVTNELDEVKFIYHDHLDAIGFIGMLINTSDNSILYKGVIYIRANATRTFDGLSYNYNNPNFYIYLPNNNLNGKEVTVIEGSTTGFNLLDNDLIHIEDKNKESDPFSILGLAVTDPSQNNVSIVDQAIRGQKVKLNAITNLGYFYNSSTTNTEDYGYVLNYEISNLNNYLPYSDTKLKVQRVIGDTSNYDESEIKIWNIKKSIATDIKEITTIWDLIKDPNDNSKIRDELNNGNSVVTNNVIHTYPTNLPEGLIYDNYGYYYIHTYTEDGNTKSNYFAVIFHKDNSLPDFPQVDIHFTKQSIPYVIEDGNVYCYSLLKTGTPDITLTLNNYSIQRKNYENIVETIVSKEYTNKTISLDGTLKKDVDLIEDQYSIIESKCLIKTNYDDIKKEVNSTYELNIININGDSFDLTGNVLVYKLLVYHNYNNFNKKLYYNTTTQEYELQTRTSVNKPTYFFKTWQYGSSNNWNIIEKDIDNYTYYTTPSSNIVQKNQNIEEDIYWVVNTDGNTQIKYSLQPKIRVSEQNNSWLHNIFITNNLQELTAIIPVFKIGTTINYINKENIKENIDIKNATRIGIFNRQVFLYGPYTKSNFLQFSMFEEEWYFPFPYYNIEFEEPITWVYNYKNDLIVFTKYNILKLSGSSSILECKKSKLYENLSISLSDINMINVVNKYLLFFNNNMGYIMVPNLYTTDPLENANIYKLSENIINLENDPEHYIRSRKHISQRYNIGYIVNKNPKTYVQNNEIYLIYNYNYNNNYIPVIYIYNTDYKYWRLYDCSYVKAINNYYICEPYLNNQFIAKDENDNNVLLILDNIDSSNTCKDKVDNVISDTKISCLIESGYLSVDTMNDKRFKDLIIELDRILDTLTIKCNFYIDGFPVLIEDQTGLLIDKYNNVNEVSATRYLDPLVPEQVISLEQFDAQYNDNYFGVIYKLSSETSPYFLGNRNHFRIPLFGKGRLPSFTLEITSNKIFEFINYSIIYKEKNINRRR